MQPLICFHTQLYLSVSDHLFQRRRQDSNLQFDDQSLFYFCSTIIQLIYCIIAFSSHQRLSSSGKSLTFRHSFKMTQQQILRYATEYIIFLFLSINSRTFSLLYSMLWCTFIFHIVQPIFSIKTFTTCIHVPVFM